MSRNRILVGGATLLLGLSLSTGVAAAQELRGAAHSGGHVESNTATTGEPGTVVTESEGAAGTAQTPPASGTDVPAAAATAPAPASSGTLPITGGDVLGLALFGAGAIAAGTVLVRRSRTTRIA